MKPLLHTPEAEGRQELPENTPAARGKRRVRVLSLVDNWGRVSSMIGLRPTGYNRHVAEVAEWRRKQEQ